MCRAIHSIFQFICRALPFLIIHFQFSAAKAQSIDYFERLEKNSQNKIHIDSLLAIPYDVMVSNLNLSSQWFERALQQEQTANGTIHVADIYTQLGIIKYLQGIYDSSTYFNLRAAALYEKLQLPAKRGLVLCAQGYQTKRRNLDEAFHYYRQGINLLETHAKESELAGTYDNFGVLYEMRNQLDSATFYYTKALAIKITNQDSIGLPYTYNNLALVKLMTGEPEAAKNYFDKAYTMRIARNDLFGIAQNEAYYGDYYLESKNWERAIEWYTKSNNTCDNINYMPQKLHNLNNLAICFERLGKYKEALDAAKESALLQSEIHELNKTKAILELEQKFKVAEKDKSIIKLQKDSAEKRMWIILVSSVLFLVVLLAALLQQISKRKATAAKDAAVIAEREFGLKAVFDATEEERKRIAKDLHDGLGQKLSGLRLSWEGLTLTRQDLPKQEIEKIKNLTAVLDEASSEVRTISHMMMPKALGEFGLLVALQDLFKKSIGLTGIRYQIEHLGMEGQRFDERVELSLYRICQELISNMIKHSNASEVTLQIMNSKNQLIFIAEDNGIGFDPTQHRDGIGLLNIQTRLQTIGGDIHWERGPVRGMVATIRVPLEE